MQSKLFFLSLIFSTILTSMVSGQGTTDPFCNDDSYRVLQRVAGETISVTCDTVYLLNKGTFYLLNSSYEEYKQQSSLLSVFTDSVDQYITLYKDRVDEQKKEFDTLGLYYRNLSDSSKLLVNSANEKLQTINTNLDSIQHNIATAKTNLTDVQELVKKSEKKKWLFGAVGGAIGFGVGFMMATAIVLLATN